MSEMRETFEERHRVLSDGEEAGYLSLDEDGNYKWGEVQKKWETWQDAWQAARAQGDAELSPEELFDHYMRTAIANAPEPVQRLGEYLTSVLNEDQWPEAERLLNQICTHRTTSGAPARWKPIPYEPTQAMIDAAEDAHMPFGDMDLAIRCAVLAAPQPPKQEGDHEA